MLEHSWVPKHEIVSESEVNSLLKDYSCTRMQLPKIFSDDPVIELINAKAGDVVRISRPNGSEYFRLVT
ncbi:MAG: DNA-directed RNA polymerase subunit H [Candidatus Diapherotrites archaeon]|nr:DNA-directed RNA polymerase subunit H [Candidatus Diapherotrites archaeon]